MPYFTVWRERQRLYHRRAHRFGADTQVYGFLAGSGLAKSCEAEVVGELVELQQRTGEYAPRV